MPVDATLPTSRRGYLSQAELEQFANIQVEITEEADDVISQAEEIIDSFVGYQEKFFGSELKGLAVGGSTTTISLETEHQNVYQKNYFQGCEVEIIGGTGAGQRRTISSSTYAGQITVSEAFDTAPTVGSFYRIYQLGKFPRVQDVEYYTKSEPYTYYKAIPENVKRAVAAQVEFIVEMGNSYFNSDKTRKQSESLGDYSYSYGNGGQEIDNIIAPKAKMLIRGYKRRIGELLPY